MSSSINKSLSLHLPQNHDIYCCLKPMHHKLKSFISHSSLSLFCLNTAASAGRHHSFSISSSKCLDAFQLECFQLISLRTQRIRRSSASSALMWCMHRQAHQARAAWSSSIARSWAEIMSWKSTWTERMAMGKSLMCLCWYRTSWAHCKFLSSIWLKERYQA